MPQPAVLVLAVAIGQVVILFGHWIVYQTLKFGFFLGGVPMRQGVWAALVVMALSFLVAQVLVSRWSSRPLDIFYAVAAVWLGTMHILLLACGIFWLIAAVAFSAGVSLPWQLLIGGLFLAAILTDIYALYNSFRTRVTRYDIALQNLPPAWRGRKAVLVSDTHLGNVRQIGSAEKLVRMINAEKPDIVFIPGDFFDGPVGDYKAMAAPLANITAPLGVYFSEGNHEEFQNPAPYLAALRAANVKILENEMVEIDGMQILGIPYAASYRRKGLHAALAKIPFDKSRCSILLKHAPSSRGTAAAAGISLMLCGHTHKGQMWPANLFAWHLFGKSVYGRSEKDGMQIVTSSGFGTWGPPQRLGTKGEIVVITFS